MSPGTASRDMIEALLMRIGSKTVSHTRFG